MSDKYFIDTNIFVYCFDETQEKKRKISLELVAQALQYGAGMISWQVVQEFLNVSTRKFRTVMKSEDANLYLEKILYPLCRIFPELDVYQSAIRIQNETAYSFYDSLMIAGAVKGGCRTLYSEDLQNDHVIGAVRVVNPFLAIE